MADNQETPKGFGESLAGPGGDGAAVKNAAGGAASPKPISAGTSRKPPPAPARRGRKPKTFGPVAEARREANERYEAKKSKAGASLGGDGEQTRAEPPPKARSPGYAKQLVRYHEEAAALLEMPELKISQASAEELEWCVMEVLADNNVVLTSPRAHMWGLIGCVAMIYGPIVLALVRRFVIKPPGTQGENVVPLQRPPARPAQAQQAAAAPVFRTVNPSGFPEKDVQVFDDGTRAAGAFISEPGQQGPLSGFGTIS